METFVFKNHNGAFQPFVIEHIRNAEALFIAGGDQSKYVDFWKGTPVEDAINYLANVKKDPIGGTSAGMAILGEFLYSAMSNSSLDLRGSPGRPFHNDLTLDRDFLSIPTQAGIITDQHLIERDRMGRTVAFLARLVHDGWTDAGPGHRRRPRDRPARGPRRRAAAEVFATPTHPTPYVYFLRTPGPPEVCSAGRAADLPQRRGVPHRPRRLVRPRRPGRATTGSRTRSARRPGVLTSSRGAIY